MDSERPKLALFAVQNTEVLRLLAGLADAYRVALVQPNEDILRAHRTHRFELVLFFARSRDIKRFSGLSRRLKTEQKAPRVCLVSPSGLRGDPAVLLEAYLLDGLYGGDYQPKKILDWLHQVRRDERPITGDFTSRGRFRAALRKISESRVSSTDE